MKSPHRYDAFLSYSQRDHSTVVWLRDVSTGYWVPGRKRRAIFLDRMSLGAGVLNDGLVERARAARALRATRRSVSNSAAGCSSGSRIGSSPGRGGDLSRRA